MDANASAGAETISFAIPGAGCKRSLLVAATNHLRSGDNRRDDAAGVRRHAAHRAERQRPRRQRLTVTAGLTTIRGLIINRFGGTGIVLAINSGNIVEGNYIGTDPPERSPWPIEARGRRDVGQQSDWRRRDGSGISSPAIAERESWLTAWARTATSSSATSLARTLTGTAALPNGFEGISISSGANNQIGGAAGAGNVLSGNALYGIAIFNGGMRPIPASRATVSARMESARRLIES